MKRRMVAGVVLRLLATLATANRGQGQAPDKVAPDKVTSEFGPSSGIAPCSWYTTWGSVHDTPRSSLTRAVTRATPDSSRSRYARQIRPSRSPAAVSVSTVGPASTQCGATIAESGVLRKEATLLWR